MRRGNLYLVVACLLFTAEIAAWRVAAAKATPGSLAKEALGVASKTRGLKVLEKVPTRVVSRTELLRYIDRRIQTTGAGKEASALGVVLKSFGVVSKDFDLLGFYRATARQEVAGYYAPEAKTLFVLDWLPSLLVKPTLVHEATHALQDQHFGLKRFLHAIPGCSEPQTAATALVEGDATAVMMESLGSGESVEPDMLEDAAEAMDKFSSVLTLLFGGTETPEALRYVLLFPYVQGVRLVYTLKRHGDFNEVNQAYSRLPVSTEQVLHPSKFLNRQDPPLDVWCRVRRFASLKGYRLVGTNIMGELGFRAVFRQLSGRKAASKIAEGWGGDRYYVYRNPRTHETVVLILSVWDSESDAVEFLQGLRHLPEHGRPVARRFGKTVAAVFGLDEDRAPRLAATLARHTAWRPLRTWGEWVRWCHRRYRNLVR